MFRKTMRTAAFAIAAAVVCFISQDATAQICPYGGGGYNSGFNRGIGGNSFNLSIGRTKGGSGFNNGFGGINNFGRSGSAYRSYGSSRYVPTRSYGGGFNSFGRSGFRY